MVSFVQTVITVVY